MLSPGALDLVRGLLTYDPTKRLLAEAALAMPYFTTEAPPMQLPAQYVLHLCECGAEWPQIC
jgi:CTD kinase subunit alpha